MPVRSFFAKDGLRAARSSRPEDRSEAFAGKAQRTRIRLGFSLLARYLKQDYHWTNTDYPNIVIAFRVAYSIGQILCGRLLDRIATRRGLTLSVLW